MCTSAPLLNSAEEKRQFRRNVITLVIPMALQNLINVAVNAADVFMLEAVSETVLSGSYLAGQIQFIMTLIFFGITSGASVLSAQYWGKGETEQISKILGIALRISLCVAAVFTVAGFCFPQNLLNLFTNEAEVAEEGAKYLRILSLSFPMMAISSVYLNIMRSVERVVISTVVYLSSLLINITLNAILIFGLLGVPELGIVGAATATVIARAAELLIVLIYGRLKNNPVRLSPRILFLSDKPLLSDFFRYASPVILNELFWGGGSSMNSLIIGHLGTSAVAANSIAQMTRNLATVVAFGVANATAIMIGKAIGEGDSEKAKLYGKRLVRLTLIVGAVSALIVLGVLPVLHGVMSLEPQTWSKLVLMMCVMSYFTFAQAYNTTMIVGVFRAGGDTRFGLILDISTMWGCSIALGALCAFVLELPFPVVYIVLMSDEIIKLLPTTLRYRKRLWLKNLTR